MPYLLPLPLRGVGTPDVEAFGTYIHRLAIVHGVTTGKLLDHVLKWYAADHPEALNGLAGLQSTPDLCAYIRPNQATQQLVRILTHATGQKELRSGTFLALIDALDRSVGVFSARTRWCPSCMLEFEVVHDPGYLKLVWQLQAVTHCPTHGVLLRDKCTECGAHQSSFGKRNNCWTCCKCGEPLWRGVGSEEKSASWKTDGSDLIELVQLIANDPELTFPADGVRNALSAIFDKVWAQEQEGSFWELIPRDECINITTGHLPVSLTTARRLAFRLGIHLTDLLAGTVAMSPAVLDHAWTKVLPEEMRPRKRLRTHNKDKVREKLRGHLRRDEISSEPLSLEVTARLADVSVGYLHYHFPTLARRVIERRREWIEKQQQMKRLKTRAAVLEFFTSEKYSLERKSRKNALRVLRAETYLPKNLLRQEIATVLQITRTPGHRPKSGAMKQSTNLEQRPSESPR